MTESVGAAAAVAPPSTMSADALDVDGASPSSSTSAAPQAVRGRARWRHHRPLRRHRRLRRRRRPRQRRARRRLLRRRSTSACSSTGGGTGRCRPCGRSRRACRPSGPAIRPARCARPASLFRVSAPAAPCAPQARLRSPTATTTWPAAAASGSAYAARAACGRMRARVRWGKIRAHAAYAVLARALLSAQGRALERRYAPGGAGYVYARDDFEARADKLPRLM